MTVSLFKSEAPESKVNVPFNERDDDFRFAFRDARDDLMQTAAYLEGVYQRFRYIEVDWPVAADARDFDSVRTQVLSAVDRLNVIAYNLEVMRDTRVPHPA